MPNLPTTLDQAQKSIQKAKLPDVPKTLPSCLCSALRFAGEAATALPPSLLSKTGEFDEVIEYCRPFMLGFEPGEITATLRAIAERCMGEEKAAVKYTNFQCFMDAQHLAELSHDLCRLALWRTWGAWDKPWMPGVLFIKEQVANELAERQHIFGSLIELRAKLSTLAMKERWDTEARERHRRLKDAEWVELRRAVASQER